MPCVTPEHLMITDQLDNLSNGVLGPCPVEARIEPTCLPCDGLKWALELLAGLLEPQRDGSIRLPDLGDHADTCANKLF